jgi:hypothetical protein
MNITDIYEANETEQRFFDEFKDTMCLIRQPNVMSHGVIKWTPDFIDAYTGVYYEIIASRQAYHQHKKKGHFDFMLKNNITIVIAVYYKALDHFFLVEYNDNFRFLKSTFLRIIKSWEYKREYGDGTNIFQFES